MLLLSAVLLVVRLWQGATRESYAAPGPLAVSRAIVIPPDGTAAAAAALRAGGAISYRLEFRVAAWATRGQGPLHAGAFFIPARSSLREILGILRFAAPGGDCARAAFPTDCSAVQPAGVHGG